MEAKIKKEKKRCLETRRHQLEVSPFHVIHNELDIDISMISHLPHCQFDCLLWFASFLLANSCSLVVSQWHIVSIFYKELLYKFLHFTSRNNPSFRYRREREEILQFNTQVFVPEWKCSWVSEIFIESCSFLLNY